MSSEGVSRWQPNLASRLAVLLSDARVKGWDEAEVQLRDTPVPCFFGAALDGALWIRIECDPDTVSLDDRSVLVKISKRSTGYRVVVESGAVESVALHFLEDVVVALKADHPPGDVGRAALQAWRELLARAAGRLLGDEALVGLFGELEVLELVIEAGGSLDHWTGWDADHYDFRLPGLAIEVKSTSSADFRRVQIHGLRQLADPEDGSELVLVLRRVELSPTGRSVPRLIEDIVHLGIARSVLLDRLSRVHYSEQHRAEYESTTFVSQEVALRRVDDQHPRLVPEMLEDVDLSCIDKVDYELNLNGVAGADLSVNLQQIIKECVG